MTTTSTSDFTHAMEVFARGFSFTRGFTHPYLARQVDGAWHLRDGPRKGKDACRREEWIVHGFSPAKIDALARREARGRFCISALLALDESDEPLRLEFRQLGYRLNSTESFMVHRLGSIPKTPAPFPVQRVLGEDLAERIAKAAKQKQILPQYLREDAPLRLYAAMDGPKPVGWLRSITVGDSTWASNVFVLPAYRRRGIGKAMLAKMLRDDRAHGAERSVLTASHSGAMLYPVVGYELIGKLLLFTPGKG